MRMSNLHRIQWIDSRIRENRFPNCTTIAEEFCISVRQASRDVEYLKYSLGAPVEYSESRKGYYYTEKTFTLPSVLVTEDEKKALLYLAERYKAYGSEMTARLAALFEKIGGGEPGTQDADKPIPVIRIKKGEASVSQVLKYSIANKLKARIVYVDSANRRTERTIRPYILHSSGAASYVVGLCELRNAERSFRLDKIRSAACTDEPFEIPATFDPSKFAGGYRYDFRIPYEAVIRFDGRMNESGLDGMSKTGEDTYTARFDSSAALFARLVSLNTPFTILAPSWLKEKCAAFFLNLYEKNAGRAPE